MKVTSVNVGRSRRIAVGAGTVASAIGKRSAAGPVALRPLGLAGDEQGNLSVHGGLAFAVEPGPSEVRIDSLFRARVAGAQAGT